MPYQKRAYQARRRAPARKRTRYSPAKKMVTGHGPTLLEKLASGVGTAAKVAMAVAPAIAAINTEAKYFDQAAAVVFNTPGTNDSLTCLTGAIAQGLTDVTRIGNSLLAKDIQVKMAFNFAATTTVVGLHCRWMVFVWKENVQSNTPTVAKIFENPSNLYSTLNKDYTDQFVVLKDKFFCMNANMIPATTLTQGFSSTKFYKKLNWHMRFLDGTNNGWTQNHIYILFRGSGTSVSGACTFVSRLNYTDN